MGVNRPPTVSEEEEVKVLHRDGDSMGSLSDRTKKKKKGKRRASHTKTSVETKEEDANELTVAHTQRLDLR